jgi:hypothetical protein
MCVARILQLEAAANRALRSLSDMPAGAPRVAKSLTARDMRLSCAEPASMLADTCRASMLVGRKTGNPGVREREATFLTKPIRRNRRRPHEARVRSHEPPRSLEK